MYPSSSPRTDLPSLTQDGRNLFRERFGALSSREWHDLWLAVEHRPEINGVSFPAMPDKAMQLQLHGAVSWEISIREAFVFYDFIKSLGVVENAHSLLDFGCGWGRMLRPFMRDFNLAHIYGFEPNFAFATVARALNPYVTIFSGGFQPNHTLPRDWFDLVIGWSVFSHLSPASAVAWLREISDALTPGGHAVFTTWGLKFFRRLQREQAEMAAGKEIHWHSKKVLSAIGEVEDRIAAYERGEFVWFPVDGGQDYGEAALGQATLGRLLDDNNLGLRLVAFDDKTLPQDAFVLQKL